MRFQLRSLFSPKPQPLQGIVAISFFSNGFALAIARYEQGRRPRLLFCDYITAPQQNWPIQLETLLKNHQLQHYSCHILLTTDQYRTFSIEYPQVPAEEVKQAVQWRVAEMLDYPVEQAVIDFYPLPKSNRANRPHMLEVFCCNKSVLAPLLTSCQQAGLRVSVVDIQEAALRNLAILLPEDDQGAAILYLRQMVGHVIIEKHGMIYLSRKFDFNARFLTESMYKGSSEADNEQTNLALEIQRSFDYVENYFDVPPITSVVSVLLPSNTEAIINTLMIGHGMTARAMDLSATVDLDMPLSDSLQNLCAPVIGASLRWQAERRP